MDKILIAVLLVIGVGVWFILRRRTCCAVKPEDKGKDTQAK